MVWFNHECTRMNTNRKRRLWRNLPVRGKLLRFASEPIKSRRARAIFIRVHSCSFVVSPQSRSEEHTSELQSQSNLVCRLLLEKKKKHKCSILSRVTDTVQVV